MPLFARTYPESTRLNHFPVPRVVASCDDFPLENSTGKLQVKIYNYPRQHISIL